MSRCILPCRAVFTCFCLRSRGFSSQWHHHPGACSLTPCRCLCSLLTTTPPVPSHATSSSKPSSHGSVWQRMSTSASSGPRATGEDSASDDGRRGQRGAAPGHGYAQADKNNLPDKNSQRSAGRDLDTTTMGSPGQWPPASLPSQERLQASLLPVRLLASNSLTITHAASYV